MPAKAIQGKIHHHTGLLIAEELIILFLCLILATAVYGATTIMPMKVNLISCGETREDLPKACKANSACCVFLNANEMKKVEQLPEPLPKKLPEESEYIQYE